MLFLLDAPLPAPPTEICWTSALQGRLFEARLATVAAAPSLPAGTTSFHLAHLNVGNRAFRHCDELPWLLAIAGNCDEVRLFVVLHYWRGWHLKLLLSQAHDTG